jgi:CRISPR-associated protein Csm2
MPPDVRGQGHGRHAPGTGHGNRPPGSSQAPPEISKVSFGNIDPKLYSDIAEQNARLVASADTNKNKPSQLRRFYDELVMLQHKVGSSGERFDEQQPFIQMLKAKVAYAKGREKVDDNFAFLLGRVVDESKDPGRLKQARLFMEAFMAFYKVARPRD